MRSRPRMTRIALFILIGGVLLYAGLRISARPAGSENPRAIIGKQSDGTIFVPTGQTLAPAGRNITFDGRPVDMALSPDGKTLAMMMPGEVRLFDRVGGQFRTESLPGRHGFGGMAWSKDSRSLYTTGTDSGKPAQGAVLITRFDEAGHASAQKPITFKFESRIKPNLRAVHAMPAGLALARDEKTLYVSLFNNGTLAAVDLTTYNAETGDVKYTETPVGSSPEKVILTGAGDKVYVANRGGKAPESGDTMDFEDPVVVDPETYKAATGTASVVDTAHLDQPAKTISIGLQPTAMILSPDSRRLFIANANSDTVSVVDTASDQVVETIPTSPAPGHLGASSPNGLAIANDGGTLFVTLGGDNAVEILRLDAAAGGKAAETKIAGLIPTAWFPLDVVLSQDGRTLYVANSKGIGSAGAVVKRPRSAGAMTAEAGPGGAITTGDYLGHTVYAVVGSIGVVPVPDAKTLQQMTAVVARCNHFDRMEATLTEKPDAFWPRFKHVILVIKENRTYDQVFGDVPVPAGHIGGDRNLVMFGEKVTPNHHTLAHEYGLFDNLYCSGAISADGHHWLNEAFADDYDERAMNNYPRSYPCCGTDPLAYAGNKFIWQAAMDAGLTFRNYGEFGPLPSMKRHSDPTYNSNFTVTEDRNRDVAHFERILAEMEKQGEGGGLAQLTTIWFGNDHTSGIAPGAYTPESDLADNDLALGKLVDAVSHSKRYWQDEPTAIFVVEDDAQGGLDHVEGHRTVGLVISPFNKRGQVFSTNFNQLNMLRTMELILGLKPLNQFDAAALSMRDVFENKGDFRPYELRKNLIALNLKNPPLKKLSGTARHWAAISASLDFSSPDRADPELLTEALWRHSHGDAAYPPADAAR